MGLQPSGGTSLDCLELTGSSHGVSRYYSRIGWERKGGEDIETFKARAFVR